MSTFCVSALFYLAPLTGNKKTSYQVYMTQHLWRKELCCCRSMDVEQSPVSLIGHELRTINMATENISVWELNDHNVSRLLAYLHLRNILTYLFTYDKLMAICDKCVNDLRKVIYALCVVCNKTASVQTEFQQCHHTDCAFFCTSRNWSSWCL